MAAVFEKGLDTLPCHWGCLRMMFEPERDSACPFLATEYMALSKAAFKHKHVRNLIWACKPSSMQTRTIKWLIDLCCDWERSAGYQAIDEVKDWTVVHEV